MQLTLLPPLTDTQSPNQVPDELGSPKPSSRTLRGLSFDEGDETRRPKSEPLERRSVPKKGLPEGDKTRGLDTDDKELGDVADAIDLYNRFAAQTSNEGFQTRFEVLQAVERLVYAWFKTASKKSDVLRDNKHNDAMRDLLATVEQEHEALVEASKNIDEVLPFNAAELTKDEAELARKTWRDIVGSRGNIKISGSDKYQRRVYSELAKILGTPTGVKLLTFLNTPKKGEEKPLPINQIFIGETLKELPDEVKQGSELTESSHSEAQPLGDKKLLTPTRSKVDKDSPPDSKQFPTLDPKNPRGQFEGVVGGAKGFVHDDEKYAYGEGTGSFVTSFPGRALNANKDGREILTPGWVTLGHELGHSANMKAGGTHVTEKGMVGSSLAVSLAGGKTESEQWDNAEEQLVIENVENGLRRESGQDERFGHQLPQRVIKKSRDGKDRARAPLLKALEGDKSLSEIPAFKNLLDAIGRLSGKDIALKPETLAALERDVQEMVKPEKLREVKRSAMIALLQPMTTGEVKAAAIIDAIDEKEWCDTLIWLKIRQDRATEVKDKLHVNTLKHVYLTKEQRQQERVEMLRKLVSGEVKL